MIFLLFCQQFHQTAQQFGQQFHQTAEQFGSIFSSFTKLLTKLLMFAWWIEQFQLCFSSNPCKKGWTCLSKKINWVCFFEATLQIKGSQFILWATPWTCTCSQKKKKQIWKLEPWFGCQASQHIRHSLAEHRGLISLKTTVNKIWLNAVLGSPVTKAFAQLYAMHTTLPHPLLPEAVTWNSSGKCSNPCFPHAPCTSKHCPGIISPCSYLPSLLT